MLIGLMKKTQEKMQEIYPGKKVTLCLKKHQDMLKENKLTSKSRWKTERKKTASGEVKQDGTVVIENFEID